MPAGRSLGREEIPQPALEPEREDSRSNEEKQHYVDSFGSMLNQSFEMQFHLFNSMQKYHGLNQTRRF